MKRGGTFLPFPPAPLPEDDCFLSFLEFFPEKQHLSHNWSHPPPEKKKKNYSLSFQAPTPICSLPPLLRHLFSFFCWFFHLCLKQTIIFCFLRPWTVKGNTAICNSKEDNCILNSKAHKLSMVLCLQRGLWQSPQSCRSISEFAAPFIKHRVPGGSVVNNPPTVQGTWGQFLGQENLLEKGMDTHSSIFA